MSEIDPWSGLSTGGKDSRRVDALGLWDWFWTIVPPNSPALALKLPFLPEQAKELPTLRGMQISIHATGDGALLLFKLQAPAEREVFKIFCRDVVDATKEAVSHLGALEAALSRTSRWHQLMRRGNNGLLSEEAQKGLMGEIGILEKLADRFGVEVAIDAWKGPYGSPKDFELGRTLLELKTKRLGARPFVKISSEFQLADVDAGKLYLGVTDINSATGSSGTTLTEMVEILTKRFSEHGSAQTIRFETALHEVGFDSTDDYSAFRWQTGTTAWYRVEGNFPRITSAPQGISDVTYSLALADCEPYLTDWTTITEEVS